MVAMATSHSLLGVVFYSIDANTSCSFTKQDLIVKQANHVSFCFVLCNEPSGQIKLCHAKSSHVTTLLVFD